MNKLKKISNFDGLEVLNIDTYDDKRGKFKKIFDLNNLSQFGWRGSIHQINLSETLKKGTLRGMHLQFYHFSEYKLVTCIRGSVFDVVLDLRRDSKTFMNYFQTELSESKNNSILIPSGFAHGFQSLENNSQLIYAHSKDYRPKFEGGCLAIDKNLGIEWPLKVTKISERDLKLPTLDVLIKKKDFLS